MTGFLVDNRSMDSMPRPHLFGGIGHPVQPERRLLLAVLEGAVSDFQKYATASTGRGRRLFAEADAWFGSTATERIVDFESICLALGFDASFVRGGLQRWCTARLRESS